MKKINILPIVVSLLLFCSCSNKIDNTFVQDSIENSDTVTDHIVQGTEQTVSENNNSSTNSQSTFTFSANMNVYYKDKMNAPLNNRIEINNNEQILLSILTSVSPDITMPQNDVPVRIMVLADDTPIKFSVFDEVKSSEYNDVLLDANTDQIIDIKFSGDDKVKMISILFLYYPDNGAEIGNEFRGSFVYPMVNINASTDMTTTMVSSENYVEVNAVQDNYGIDIGDKSLKDNNVIVEPHHYKDIDISSTGELYLKFNSGDKNDYPYYLFLLIDGHLVNAFGEKSSVQCYSACGTKSFQYQIPRRLIPNNGVHYFQAVAIPCGITENIIAISSVRVKVQC